MSRAVILRTLPHQESAPASTLLAGVTSVSEVAAGYCRIVVDAPGLGRVRAGQFCLLGSPPAVEGRNRALSRPMAVYNQDVDAESLEFVCKIIGEGTRQLATLRPGDRVRLTGPLGRGFDLRGSGPVLILARGVGVFSLGLVPTQLAAGRPVTVLLSGRDRAALLGAGHFHGLGATVLPVTDQDSTSSLPAVAAVLLERFGTRQPPTLVLSCGSERLMRLGLGLALRWGARMQTSVEANMACGLGFCHGCAHPAGTGRGEDPLVCVDGPTFEVEAPGDLPTEEECAADEHIVA